VSKEGRFVGFHEKSKKAQKYLFIDELLSTSGFWEAAESLPSNLTNKLELRVSMKPVKFLYISL
jgi:hypothetical protein